MKQDDRHLIFATSSVSLITSSVSLIAEAKLKASVTLLFCFHQNCEKAQEYIITEVTFGKSSGVH